MSSESPQSGGGNSAASGSAIESDFSWLRVIVTLLIIVVLGGGAAAVMWQYSSSEEVLYPVRGVVYLDGKPMPGGVLETKPLNGMAGAVSPIHEDGTFELKTNYEPGAFKGEHIVFIWWTDGGFPPKSLIPEEYGDPAKSTFRVNVNASTGDEPIRFDLEGGRPIPTRAPGNTRPGIPTGDDVNASTPDDSTDEAPAGATDSPADSPEK
ncbi:MAG: hypothetical protein KDA85_04425 [Planctomycetaceae bacterium]|nr:hypothetical protein [Planctomycetaceae bacterium]